MNIEEEAKAREFAAQYGAIKRDELIAWADAYIKLLDYPPTELFDISLAKDEKEVINALNTLGCPNYSKGIAQNIFFIFHEYLKNENANYERISKGIYDMALSEIYPKDELFSEMSHYWDALDLAELEHYGNPEEVKKEMVKL